MDWFKMFWIIILIGIVFLVGSQFGFWGRSISLVVSLIIAFISAIRSNVD